MKTILVPSNDDHAEMLLSWFDSQQQIEVWGGPGMVFPCDLNRFTHAIKFNQIASFSLLNDQQELLGFGQFYIRLGRHHYGRICVAPNSRGQGLAKILMQGLMEKAQQQQSAVGHSLFVYEDNLSALNSYQSLGFHPATYPQPFPGELENCLYMVKD